MKAFVCTKFGGPGVLALEDVPRLVPGPGEVLIRVHATTVTMGDWRIMTRTLPSGFGPLAPLALGFGKPRNAILGTECAGVVEAVGKDVRGFATGDRVVAYPGGKQGAHAEYLAIAATGAIAPIPEEMGFAEAAALPFGGVTALTYLENWGKVQPGEHVLVVGASGCVGSAAVQLARYFGAKVTGVCSGRNADLVRSLGADHVIDYTESDVLQSQQRYDLILDTVGGTRARALKHLLTASGRLLLPAAGLGDMVRAGFSGGRTIVGDAKEDPAVLRRLVEIAGAGGIRPVIEKTYPFSDLPAAMARVGTHRKRGSLVIDLGRDV